MPTYEYRCPKGHRFDVFQKMSDPPVATCPECGQPGERMIVPGAGFLFKGEGFYITDYRSDDYKKRKAAGEEPKSVASPGKSDSGSKSDAGESKPAKSEPKPEAKPEKKPDTRPDTRKGKRSSGDE
jgi:putative FmdB family regulatory protein